MALTETHSASHFDTIFICAGFFGYANNIIEEMRSRGRKVLHFEDRPNAGTLSKMQVRLLPSLPTRSLLNLENEIKQSALANSERIKDVLIIKGEAISAGFIKELRSILPKARFTLYFWDSYRNMPRSSFKKVSLFDAAYSFDPQDCKIDHRLTYRPLFFSEHTIEKVDVEKDIDVLFLGTIHSDRFKVLSKLEKKLGHDVKFVKFMYYPSKLLFRIRKKVDPLFWYADEGQFSFVPLTRAEANDLISRARISVDIEREVQSGFTMRTMEVFGAQRKIITTNRNIVEAEFYNPANICVVDRRSPDVPKTFFNSPFVSASKELLYRYSLQGWLDEVLPSGAE